jgi:hypothetical protein
MYIPACFLQERPYKLFTSFNVPQFFRDDKLNFTPNLLIEFYDGITLEQISCVKTGTLAQMAVNLRLQKRMRIFIFISVFVICLIGHWRQRQAGANAQANKRASIIPRFHYCQTARVYGCCPIQRYCKRILLFEVPLHCRLRCHSYGSFVVATSCHHN